MLDFVTGPDGEYTCIRVLSIRVVDGLDNNDSNKWVNNIFNGFVIQNLKIYGILMDKGRWCGFWHQNHW